MKKLFTLMLLVCFVLAGFAQQNKYAVTINSKNFNIHPMLYEYLGESQVNNLKASDLKQLVVENYNLTAYCYIALKMSEVEGTYQMKGELKNYVKDGKSCNYEEIIKTGAFNRYDYNLPQDATLLNIFPMGSTGAYIIVLPKTTFDNRKSQLLEYYGL